MNLKLKELRKRAGYKNRDDFAEKLGVNKYTYRSWEQGAAMMSLEQAFNVSRLLGCTLDELAGRTPPPKPCDDERQAAINEAYESMDEGNRSTLSTVAQSLSFANMKNEN